MKTFDGIAQPQSAPAGAPNVTALTGVDLADPATFARETPHAAFDLLRAQAPVAWHDEQEKTTSSSELSSGLPAPYSPGFWAVTRHDLVEHVSKHPEVFSSELGGSQLFSADEISLASMRLMMLNIDPPDQVRLRKVVSPAFTPRSVNALRQFVLDQARDIAEGLPTDTVVDAVDLVSKELTTRVLAEILGMPQADRHLIVKWSDGLVGFEAAEQDGNAEEVMLLQMELFAYGQQVLVSRRENPTGDLMSEIANAEIDGERLSDDEFCFFWILLIIAGNETTRNSITASILHLQEQGLWERLVARPELLTPVAIEELIRFASPVTQFRRTATRDVELGGQQIRAGDKVVIYYPAANRDPEHFDTPHELVLDRDRNPHLAFGVGPHFCLGTRVARLQMHAMLTELVTRHPSLRVVGEPVRTRSSFIAGLDSLPVHLGPPVA